MNCIEEEGKMIRVGLGEDPVTEVEDMRPPKARPERPFDVESKAFFWSEKGSRIEVALQGFLRQELAGGGERCAPVEADHLGRKGRDLRQEVRRTKSDVDPRDRKIRKPLKDRGCIRSPECRVAFGIKKPCPRVEKLDRLRSCRDLGA